MARSSAPRNVARRRRTGAGLRLALAGATLMAGSGLGYIGYVLWPRWPQAIASADPPALPIAIAGTVFNIPTAAIRVPLQRHAGAQPRLDLAYSWPELAPPHPAKPAISDDPQPAPALFLTLAAPDGTLPVEERLKAIYPRYVEAAAFGGPEGLAGVSFRDGTPYQGEDLFFPYESPERFLARCTRDSGPTAGACLVERQIGSAALTARFPRDWLGEWREIATGIDRLVASWHIAGG